MSTPQIKHTNFSFEVPTVDHDFKYLSALLKKMTGINLDTSNRSQVLMSTRVRSLYQKYNISNYRQIADQLELKNETFIKDFVSALTTNTTNFFREGRHFDFLKEELKTILPRKVRQGNMELRVWCAACSTGQEAYSIATTTLEALKSTCQSLKMIATDIDLSVLKIAQQGRYSHTEANAIPLNIYQEYFYRESRQINADIRAKSMLRRQIKFAQINLVEPFPFKKKFDIIFCRNVFIYFDESTIKSIVGKMARQLNPQGLLFVGHSEAMLDFNKRDFERISASVYRKK